MMKEFLQDQIPSRSTEAPEPDNKTFLDTGVVHGYEPLFHILQKALFQAQSGKGKERHAQDKPFIRQPILEIGRMVGHGSTAGQVIKKTQEAMRLPKDRAIAELLGAINYAAATILLIQEKDE